MAEAGAGNYYRVADVEQIPLIFRAGNSAGVSLIHCREELHAACHWAAAPSLMASAPFRLCAAMSPQHRRSPRSASSAGPSPMRILFWQLGNMVWAVWLPGLRMPARAGRTNGLTGKGFPRFWGQAVAWSINIGANENLETRVETQGDRARIIVDARDDDWRIPRWLGPE